MYIDKFLIVGRLFHIEKSKTKIIGDDYLTASA